MNGEVVMGVGGPHYAPNFTKLMNKYTIAHIIPEYSMHDLTYETFVQGVEKSTVKTEKVVLDWKGLDASEREMIVRYCGKYGIDYVKYK
jgi:D-aminoacyl-tRNA deacylase